MPSTIRAIIICTPPPKKWKKWVTLVDKYIPLESYWALICSNMGPLEGSIYPLCPATPNSQAPGLAGVPLGAHENRGPAEKVVSTRNTTVESWDPGPAPMDSGSKVRSKMPPGHFA